MHIHNVPHASSKEAEGRKRIRFDSNSITVGLDAYIWVLPTAHAIAMCERGAGMHSLRDLSPSFDHQDGNLDGWRRMRMSQFVENFGTAATEQNRPLSDFIVGGQIHLTEPHPGHLSVLPTKEELTAHDEIVRKESEGREPVLGP